MLTNEQLKKCREIFNNSDSTFDAHEDILLYLGRPLASDEIAAIIDGAENTAVLDNSAENRPAQFDALARTIADTYRRKNHDYGNSFGESIASYGLIAALTRISDKFHRAETLILHGNGSAQVNESLEDTLLDMATYCIMTVMEMK